MFQGRVHRIIQFSEGSLISEKTRTSALEFESWTNSKKSNSWHWAPTTHQASQVLSITLFHLSLCTLGRECHCYPSLTDVEVETLRTGTQNDTVAGGGIWTQICDSRTLSHSLVGPAPHARWLHGDSVMWLTLRLFSFLHFTAWILVQASTAPESVVSHLVSISLEGWRVVVFVKSYLFNFEA